MKSYKVKLFIVTYNNEKDLNNNLSSLIDSQLSNHTLEINVINNHTQFSISPEFSNKIKIYHNTLRPDFSTGHLARNWNQAIVNGFKDLNNPDCDILVTCQDDSLFDKDWLEKIIDLHSDFSFIQMGIGDNFCSYLPQAIKNIGLWDERFCGIGYQEADYFLRSLIYNKNKTCLNDYQHGRLLNPVNFSICNRPAPANIFSPAHHKSMQFHSINEKVFSAKWPGVPANYWNNTLINNTPNRSAISNFIIYPYFEKNVDDLSGKNYII